MKVKIIDSGYCDHNNSEFVIVEIKDGDKLITLQEWLNTDKDGDKFCERKNSHIVKHELKDFASLFDLTNKPTAMSLRDYLQDRIDDLFDLIDWSLNLGFIADRLEDSINNERSVSLDDEQSATIRKFGF